MSSAGRQFSLLVSLHQQAGRKQPLSKLGCIYRHLISAELVEPYETSSIIHSASNNSGPVVSSHFVIQLAYNIKFSAAAFESVDSSKAWCWFVFKGSRFGFRTTLCLEMHQHIQAVSKVQRRFLAQLMHPMLQQRRDG